MEHFIPGWTDARLPSRRRVAIWLRDEVGQGGTFVSRDLRAAVPEVEEVKRRMRELRDYGWVIENYRDDRALAKDELRLVTVGSLDDV